MMTAATAAAQVLIPSHQRRKCKIKSSGAQLWESAARIAFGAAY